MIKNVLLTVSLVFSLTTGLIEQSIAADVMDKVIAIVNDEAVTLSEYETRYRREQLKDSKNSGQVPDQIDISVLRALIDERIQAQAARRLGLGVGAPELESMLVALAGQNNLNAEQLLEKLNQQGIKPQQFLRSLEEQRLIQKVIETSVNSRVTVSEQEIDFHLEAHREIYSPDESYEISHLYISTIGKTEDEISRDLENANFIHANLLTGSEFSESAKSFSDGENKEGGGYLGWRKEDQLPEIFLGELRKTSIGGISNIIKSANGFHILKLHAKEGELQIVTQNKVRHILIQPQIREITEQEALDLLLEIKSGIEKSGDFDKYARLNSDDNLSADEGGSLGWLNPGDAAQAIEETAAELPLNQLSEPIKSQYGYHLVEVLDRRKQDISEAVARKRAKQEVFSRKAKDLYQNWFDQIRDGSYIEFVAANQ